jgi:dolichol-phosphate mannosyltransferase
MKIFIIIPTYNEKENIERLIKEIFDLKINKLSILVIDDNSPDGTADIIERLMEDYQSLFLIKRPVKLGLGSAYRDGFVFALNHGADFIFEMDADLSHQPKYIPTIFAELLNNDLVIGSRYVKGGGVENWPWWRQALSRIANLYVQFILNLKVKDATAGFRGYRKEVFQKVDLEKIISDGYSFQVELVYLVNKAGFKIKEVPIIFPDRKLGQSKIGQQEIVKAIIVVLKLRFK